jgi:2'-5' RNA ligase
VGDVGRGFVAVVPPAAVLDEVAALTGALALPGTARRTTRPQWHLTLQFLGNRVDFDAVAGALDLLAVRPGRVRLGGAGAFPSERRARVLWVGTAEGAEYLSQLVAAVGTLLAPLGHEPETRPYHAHLTLARLKAPTDLRSAVAALGSGPVGESWTAAEVALFQSRTRRTGAEYEERARIPLGERGGWVAGGAPSAAVVEDESFGFPVPGRWPGTSSPVALRPVEELAPVVVRVLEDLERELGALVPGVTVEHVGATALPDGLTKGDVDVSLRVTGNEFDAVVAALSAHFEVAQPHNWTATFASFATDRWQLPVGVQVSVFGSADDFLVVLRDRMRADRELRRRYDRVKRDAAPKGRDAYWRAKEEFLRDLLGRG